MTKCGKYDPFLSCQGSGIILSAVCAALPYLAVTVPVESSPTTLTQIMCYILQANFNGRFLPNPLPMTSALPGQTATATNTTRDTAQERAKCRCRERRGSREREGGGGISGCHVLSLLKTKISGVFLPPWKHTLWLHLTFALDAPAMTDCIPGQAAGGTG